MEILPNLLVREFLPGDEAAFRALNEEWITRYFQLEPKDHESLTNPQATILDPGGHIYCAVYGTEVIGCCALIPMGGNEFELAKMAVAPAYRGGGIGRRLFTAVIDEARKLGATRLYLETSHKLLNAIRLYESVGFRHIPAEQIVPSPYARANVYMDLSLTGT